MRVADKSVTNLVKRNLLSNRGRVADLQTKAATQKRIVKPSDDPISSVRILASRIEERTSDQFMKNANFAQSFLEFADQSLSELGDNLVRAKELLISQVNDASANGVTRRVTAEEIQQIFWHTVQIGNRKLGDRYIFSGHETTKAPFSLEGQYKGDRGDIKVQVNKDTYLAVNIPGAQVFLGEDLADDGVSRARLVTPRTVEELREFKARTLKSEDEKNFQNQLAASSIDRNGQRAPASVGDPNVDKFSAGWRNVGVNIFQVLQSAETGLRANDKVSLQELIPMVDEALTQVIMARAEVGSRSSALRGELDTLSKSKIDAKTLTSSYEDADTFKVVADLKGAQTTLETTLQTGGKLIQPSLLDFLR